MTNTYQIKIKDGVIIPPKNIGNKISKSSDFLFYIFQKCMLLGIFIFTVLIFYYFVFEKLFIIPVPEKVLINKSELSRLQSVEKEKNELMFYKYLYEDLKVYNKELEKLSVYIPENQLELVFDKVFPDVKISNEKRKDWIHFISKYSKEYSIPTLLVASIIWKESRYNEKAISIANAKGPMQVIAKHHMEKLTKIGKNENDLLTIDTGIHIGCWIFREYYDLSNKDVFVAMFKYLGGSEISYAKDILNKYIQSKMYMAEYNM